MTRLRRSRMGAPRRVGGPEAAGAPGDPEGHRSAPEDQHRLDRRDAWLLHSIAQELGEYERPERVLTEREQVAQSTPRVSSAAGQGGSMTRVPPANVKRGERPLPSQTRSRLERLNTYDTRLPRGITVEVRVLGPVEVVGWREPPDRHIVPELCCYLALHHERPVSGDSIRAALWPEDQEASAKSLRTYASLLRRSLGADLFPGAERGAGYGLSDAVTTDWGRVQVQVADADRCEAHGDAHSATLLLCRALQFVRGTPFAGVASNSYGWAWGELLVAEIERTIASIGTRVVRWAAQEGDLEIAEWAVCRSLLGVPLDEGLWDLWVDLAHRQGGAALARVLRDRRAVLGDDASGVASTDPSPAASTKPPAGGPTRRRSLNAEDRSLER